MLRKGRISRVVSALLGVVGLFLLASLSKSSENIERDVLFQVFSTVGLVSAALTITDKKPAYAALWFALVTLSVCGLFFLQSAAFLAAASVIVYAGAIIVTFMFVLMLASQAGTAGYDRHPQHPVLVTTVAFLLLGLVLCTVHRWNIDKPDYVVTDHPAGIKQSVGPEAFNPLSRLSADEASKEMPALGTLHQLGRSLFGDYLYAVEIAGSLLLVAAVGAIAIAPRRSQGTL